MTPVVSVVVATHDRAARLRRLLESLEAQTHRDFEVVVCDDASSDATPGVLAEPRGFPLTALRNETSGGPARARNAGWRAARGELIAFTDDDCEATPGWLEAGVRAWRESASGARVFLQGPVGPVEAERDRLGAFSYTIVVEGPTPVYECANIFYPRALLEEIGGFDETFPRPAGEDADLGWRARAAGARPAFADDARVAHAVVELGARGYLRRLWQWQYAMQPYGRHRGLREEQLLHGVFWTRSHYLLVRAVVGAALALRGRWAWPLAWWLAKWYLAWQRVEARKHGGSEIYAPWFLVRDVVEVAACARGSIRYRTVVL